MSTAEASRLLKITFVKKRDASPDLSFIGEYTDKKDDWVIVRNPGDSLDADYYANLVAADEEFVGRRHREYLYFKPCAGDEEPGTPEYQKYGRQDYERMESESDSDEDEFDTIKTEELSQLSDILEQTGFTKHQIDTAMQHVDEVTS